MCAVIELAVLTSGITNQLCRNRKAGWGGSIGAGLRNGQDASSADPDARRDFGRNYNRPRAGSVAAATGLEAVRPGRQVCLRHLEATARRKASEAGGHPRLSPRQLLPTRGSPTCIWWRPEGPLFRLPCPSIAMVPTGTGRARRHWYWLPREWCRCPGW